MNIREILEALFNGEKLGHTGWTEGQFIILRGHEFFNEKDRLIANISRIIDPGMNKHDGFYIIKPTVKYAPYMYLLNGSKLPAMSMTAYQHDDQFVDHMGDNMIWFKRMTALEIEV